MDSTKRGIHRIAPLTKLYIFKILTGIMLGLLLGLVRYIPMNFFESLATISGLIGILVSLAIFFKRSHEIKESMVKLILLYGTAGYFACVLSFWALILNL